MSDVPALLLIFSYYLSLSFTPLLVRFAFIILSLWLCVLPLRVQSAAKLHLLKYTRLNTELELGDNECISCDAHFNHITCCLCQSVQWWKKCSLLNFKYQCHHFKMPSACYLQNVLKASKEKYWFCSNMANVTDIIY